MLAFSLFQLQNCYHWYIYSIKGDNIVNEIDSNSCLKIVLVMQIVETSSAIIRVRVIGTYPLYIVELVLVLLCINGSALQCTVVNLYMFSATFNVYTTHFIMECVPLLVSYT